MSDIVFCTDCKWFIRNEKKLTNNLSSDGTEGGLYLDNSLYLDGEDKYIKRKDTIIIEESYYDCSHQSNIGKRVHWWGLERYYKRKPSQMNAKNDCERFERKE